MKGCLAPALFALALVAAPAAAADAVPASETVTDPLTGIRFVRIAKGCYQMGVPPGTFADQDPDFRRRVEKTEGPVHEVCVDEFWIARHEVTEAQWRAVMGPAKGQGDGRLPVSGVTWHEAATFAKRLTERAARGWRYRLPTEVEWEYACRAGAAAATRLTERERLDKLAWYSSRYELSSSAQRPRAPQPVGSKEANPAGLHDMLGNVWEWTQDAYLDDAYRRHELFNPLVAPPTPAAARVGRGGSVRSHPYWVRCEARTSLDAETRLDTVGFRLVRVPSGEK